MFSKLAVAVLATLAIFAAAAPTPTDGNDGIKDSCNTGTQYCCEDTYESNSPEAKMFEQLFNIHVPVNTKLGATCSPVNVIGTGDGGSCTAQPVCCNGNDFDGAVVVGCSPINVNL